MSTTASPPAPASSRPQPLRWTVAEFHHLCGLGLFAGRRPILIDGVILEQGPMDAPHANGVERVDAALRKAFGVDWRFRIQSPVVLSEFSDPMPDLAVRRDGL